MPPALVGIMAFGRVLLGDGVWAERVVSVVLPALPLVGWLAGMWVFATPGDTDLPACGVRRLIRPATVLFVAAAVLGVVFDRVIFIWGASLMLFLLSAGLMIAYAFRLAERLLSRDEGEGVRMMLPIVFLGIFVSAIGIVVSLIDHSAKGEALLIGGACVMIPTTALIDVAIIRIAYMLHRVAARALQSGGA